MKQDEPSKRRNTVGSKPHNDSPSQLSSRNSPSRSPRLSPSKSPSRKRVITLPDSQPDDSQAKPPFTKPSKEKELPSGDFTGDYGALALLLLLYTLQGIPMGLHATLPLMMAERNLSSTDLALFSTVSLPFAFKLLWAPLVDSVYSSWFGRRKTWIVPVQGAIGVLLLASSGWVEGLLGPIPDEGAKGSVDVKALTYLFFAFYFLAATQDIAVDGLALTVLSPRNKEYGATCNAIGQTLGYFVANVGFLALDVLELASIGSFMAFWGWVFLGSTFWVSSVKRDEHVAPGAGVWNEMLAAYKEMFLVLRLPSVRTLTVLLLTFKAPLAAFDALIGLELLAPPIKLPKERLATLATVMLPVGMLTQAKISQLFANVPPMIILLRSYKARLSVGVLLVGFVIALRQFAGQADGIPWFMYMGGFAILAVSSAASSAMFVAQMAFFNRVSDPRIGGTYMTMLNTLSNLGGQWPGTFVLAFKGVLEDYPAVDAFSVVCLTSAVLGVIWLALMQRIALDLQGRPLQAWQAP